MYKTCKMDKVVGVRVMSYVSSLVFPVLVITVILSHVLSVSATLIPTLSDYPSPSLLVSLSVPIFIDTVSFQPP